MRKPDSTRVAYQPRPDDVGFVMRNYDDDDNADRLVSAFDFSASGPTRGLLDPIPDGFYTEIDASSGRRG